MIVDRIFRLLFSLITILTFLLASYIIIPDNYLKNFNIVSIRLSDIFEPTILNTLSTTYYFYLFIAFLLFFSYNIYHNLFRKSDNVNKLLHFLIQELKFSTSLIVIFWVLKILDFSRLTIVTSSLLRLISVFFLLNFYNVIKSKYDITDILLIKLNDDLELSLLNKIIGLNVNKTIYTLNKHNLDKELKSGAYDEVWISGSRSASSNNINDTINQVVEYGISVKVDNLLDIKTSITPKFEIINGHNFISYSTAYLESNQYFFKRLFDVLFTLLISFLLIPISIIVAVIILLDSGSPIIFKQVRGGHNSKDFTIYKFRTMKLGAEVEKEALLEQNDLSGIGFKLHDDPRVTRAGHILRKYSLDEIPQFINVLKGDMSLVGPRPAPFDEIDRYEVWHRRRLSVRPGITGSWQLTNRLETNFDERIRLDLNYIDNQSFLNDLIIIIRTPLALIKHKSA